MKKISLLLLTIVTLNTFAQESLEARLTKVTKPEDPESVVKWAIYTKDMEMLKYGVEKAGSAIKKMSYSHNQMDLNKGSMFLAMTPLMQAAATGQLEMVNYLIEQKVDLDATCKAPVYKSEVSRHNGKAKGITALHFAVQKGHKEVVQALVDAGAEFMTSYLEVDAQAGDISISSTAKQWAKVHGQTEIEEMLKGSKKGAFKSMMANPMGKKKN